MKTQKTAPCESPKSTVSIRGKTPAVDCNENKRKHKNSTVSFEGVGNPGFPTS